MKVIHFIAAIDKTAGGTTAYMQLLSAEMKNLIELVVVAGTSPTPVDLPGVRVQFFNPNLARWFSVEKEFVKFLKDEQPDLVHINGIWTPYNCLFQKEAWRMGIKVILSPHGMLEPYILNRHPLKKGIGLALYQDKAINNADFLHVTAQSELNQVRKLGYHQPAAIIPNGIDLSEVKQKTDWNTSPAKNMLFLSRVHPKKGIELLIEAVAQLKSDQLKVIIAGEGDPVYVESLKKLASQKGVSHLFDFVGGVYGNQKWELFQKADLFVLPTYSENFGIVIAEALATGIPVITTTGTPWKELETYLCGWWIELSATNLTKALAEAINTSSEDLKAMGLRGRKLVAEKYSVESVSGKMKILYDWILNNCEKPKFINTSK